MTIFLDFQVPSTCILIAYWQTNVRLQYLIVRLEIKTDKKVAAQVSYKYRDGQKYLDETLTININSWSYRGRFIK